MTPAEAQEWAANVESSFLWPEQARIVCYRMRPPIGTGRGSAPDVPWFGIEIDLGPDWKPDEGPNDKALADVMETVNGCFMIAGPVGFQTWQDAVPGTTFSTDDGWIEL